MIDKKRRVMVLPYQMKSGSAARLASRLKCLRIKPSPDETKFLGRNNDVVINWGNSRMYPRVRRGSSIFLVNEPKRVAVAIDKHDSFRAMHDGGVSVPGFTTDKATAANWLKNGECKRVYCRATVTGSGGEGITIVRSPEDLPNVPLYVMSVPKAKEYRIHVFGDTVFDRQEKRARRGIREERGDDWESGIRNHDNGWVFARENIVPVDEVDAEAVKAVAALGLQFGAVDVAYSKNGEAFVLEVNTSPSVEGTTLERYVEMFEKFYEATRTE